MAVSRLVDPPTMYRCECGARYDDRYRLIDESKLGSDAARARRSAMG